MRVHKLDLRIRMCSVAGDREGNANATEPRSAGNDTWMNPDSNSNSNSSDDFSGWSGSNGGEQSDELQGKRWNGGNVGAGVAGVILFAGLTFAALSISKRSFEPKQHMEPLTKQQEVSLDSAEMNDTGEEESNKGKNAVLDTDSLVSKTGTDQDSSSYKEIDEDTFETRFNHEMDAGHSSNVNDNINKASVQQDLQNEWATDGIPVAPDSTSKLPESEGPNEPFVTSSFEESAGRHDAEILESSTELKKYPTDAQLTNSLPLVSDAAATNLNTDHQEVIPGSNETEYSNSSFDSSSSSIADTPTEPLAFEVLVKSQLDTVLEAQVAQKEDMETVGSFITKENLNVSNMVEVSTEQAKISLENNVNGGGSSGTTLVSPLAYPFANEQNENGYNDINWSRSIFDSKNPGNLSFSAGIPAPSVVFPALQAFPGKVLVPAVVDQVQGQALAALQVLKVIETDVQPGDLCTRREYARWLVSASSALSRNTVSKVYPAMYIENFTELAFDDVTLEDPDFPSIQGLAEAGLISSNLSRRDMRSSEIDESSLCFCPESPLSRQDLVTWKISLEKRQLPVADKKILQQVSGFIDIDKIDPDACPALIADLSAGEQGIIALSFGYTRLFQPDKPVTKAQAAIAIATGEASDIVSEELARIEAESMAEKAVAAHSALVDQVEKDVNASFEKELLLEREKIGAVEKLAEEARIELERLRAERDEKSIALMKERAVVDSEMEILSRLRREVEEQLQSLMSDQVEISYEKERLSKLRKDAETENQEIARLQYELEVERKALSMARAWAEDEAKRAREQAKVLEEARDRWERHGIKVVVDNDLNDEANAGVTWLNAGSELSVEGTVGRAGNLVDKLKALAVDLRGKSKDTIDKVVQKILVLISVLKEWLLEAHSRAGELKDGTASKFGGSLHEFQQSSSEFALAVKEGAKRVAGDCREGVEKFSQKFKT